MPIVIKNAWTLAPDIGKIRIAVYDVNDPYNPQYIDDAKLISGTVAGKNVEDYAEELSSNVNMTAIYTVLLGEDK